MPQGLEGLKIISESRITQMPILALLCLCTAIILVIMASFYFIGYCFQQFIAGNVRKHIIKCLITIVSSIVTIAYINAHDWPYKKIYEVVPIEKRYNIDLLKYKLIENEGEVIKIMTLEIFEE